MKTSYIYLLLSMNSIQSSKEPMHPMIQSVLSVNMATKSETLLLSNMLMKTIPINLKQATWIKSMDINNCQLEILDNMFPPNIESIDFMSNEIEIVDGNVFPESLLRINLDKNKINMVINLKDTVEKLYLSNNKIVHFDTCLPYALKILDV